MISLRYRLKPHDNLLTYQVETRYIFKLPGQAERDELFFQIQFRKKIGFEYIYTNPMYPKYYTLNVGVTNQVRPATAVTGNKKKQWNWMEDCIEY
jgi:hypothetical protein